MSSSMASMNRNFLVLKAWLSEMAAMLLINWFKFLENLMTFSVVLTLISNKKINPLLVSIVRTYVLV